MVSLRRVKVLSSDDRVRNCARHTSALIEAVANGHLEILKILLALPGVNPSAGKDELLEVAGRGD